MVRLLFVFLYGRFFCLRFFMKRFNPWGFFGLGFSCFFCLLPLKTSFLCLLRLFKDYLWSLSLAPSQRLGHCSCHRCRPMRPSLFFAARYLKMFQLERHHISDVIVVFALLKRQFYNFSVLPLAVVGKPVLDLLFVQPSLFRQCCFLVLCEVRALNVGQEPLWQDLGGGLTQRISSSLRILNGLNNKLKIGSHLYRVYLDPI